MAKVPRIGNKTAKRTPAERLRDFVLIGQWYVQGIEQSEIAKRLNARSGIHYQLDRSMISRDIKAIKEQWLNSTLLSFNERMASELAKIDEVERQAWEAWERSKTLRTERTRVVKGITPRKKTTTGDKDAEALISQSIATEKTVEQTGNPAFLSLVQSCIEQRLKIFGLYAPIQVDMTWRREATQAGIDPDLIYAKLVAAYVDELSKGNAPGEGNIAGVLLPFAGGVPGGSE